MGFKLSELHGETLGRSEVSDTAGSYSIIIGRLAFSMVTCSSIILKVLLYCVTRKRDPTTFI